MIRDVTLRDGLQLTGKPLSTATKVELARALLELGVPELEIGSMARPDVVPPLADTLDVVAALTAEELARCWVWVATPGHVRRAADAGVTRFQFCLSASDAHNRANLNRSTERSMETLPEAIDLAHGVGGEIQLCLATSFTCPFDGQVAPERVLELIADPRAARADEIVVCDTLGQATPAEVRALVAAVRQHDPRPVLFHGHDTWGAGVANSLVALEAGARAVDGCLGALGGCPFAPGAGGNTSTEDLLFALRPTWLDPARFTTVVELGERLLNTLGEEHRSRARQGARASTGRFPWAIGPSPEMS